MLIVLQTAAIAGCTLVVCMLGAFTVSMARSAHRRRNDAWARKARELGFQVHGEPSRSTMMRHRVNGVELVMSTFEDRVLTRKGSSTVTRAVVRPTTASPWSDAALVKDPPAFFGLGLLTELRFEPWFPLRTFASRPDEIGRWLLPSTRAAMAGAGLIHSVSLQSRTLSLVLEAPPADPAGVASAMEIVSAIHRGASSPPIVHRIRRRGTAVYGGSIALFFAGLLALVVFLVGPMTDPVVRGLSPIVCEEGQAYVLIRRLGRGRTNFDLMCRDAAGTRSAPWLGTMTVGAVTGTAIFVPTFLLAFAMVSSASRRAEDL